MDAPHWPSDVSGGFFFYFLFAKGEGGGETFFFSFFSTFFLFGRPMLLPARLTGYLVGSMGGFFYWVLPSFFCGNTTRSH